MQTPSISILLLILHLNFTQNLASGGLYNKLVVAYFLDRSEYSGHFCAYSYTKFILSCWYLLSTVANFTYIIIVVEEYVYFTIKQ